MYYIYYPSSNVLKFKPKFEQQNTVSAEDAAIAVDCGVNGIIVSNHGARQLDTVLSTVSQQSMPSYLLVQSNHFS